MKHAETERIRTDPAPLSEKSIKRYDCVLIATDRTTYDYRWIVEESQLVVDTRNAASGIKDKKIVKA
jgi:UDP-N-acetyl-D-glucosamine dehydrogenase